MHIEQILLYQGEEIVTIRTEEGMRLWFCWQLGRAVGLPDEDKGEGDDEVLMLTDPGLVRTMVLVTRDYPANLAQVSRFAAWLVREGLMLKPELAHLVTEELDGWRRGGVAEA